jgi:hypothetical protein
MMPPMKSFKSAAERESISVLERESISVLERRKHNQKTREKTLDMDRRLKNESLDTIMINLQMTLEWGFTHHFKR